MRQNVRAWLTTAYEKMEHHFGKLHWWPGETAFEVAVGAILTQNTAWSNVERALERLKTAGLMDENRLYETSLPELIEAIRPAGFYNLKAKRLGAFLGFLHERYGGLMENMFTEETDVLREELLSVRGIGQETADSILLYGDNRPLFVVDAYTRRILERHGILSQSWSYGDIQKMFMDNLPLDGTLYNQYHALIVSTGKHFCRATARCEGCPLQGM
jgi:endonuclease-3 related protein